MQMPTGGRRIRGGRQVSRSTRSAPAFATRLFKAFIQSPLFNGRNPGKAGGGGGALPQGAQDALFDEFFVNYVPPLQA